MKFRESKKSVDVAIKDMKPNPKNPRKNYDKQEMESLGQSMKSMGQLTACIIDEDGNILAGHRRYHEAKELGWKTLKCDIKVGLTTFEKSAVLISSNGSLKTIEQNTKRSFAACWTNTPLISRRQPNWLAQSAGSGN